MSKLIDSRLIGNSIKTLKLKSNLTQVELANLIGYSVRNIRRIENEGTNSIEVINTFAEAFDVSVMSILNGCFIFIKKLLRNLHWQPSPYTT